MRRDTGNCRLKLTKVRLTELLTAIGCSAPHAVQQPSLIIDALHFPNRQRNAKFHTEGMLGSRVVRQRGHGAQSCPLVAWSHQKRIDLSKRTCQRACRGCNPRGRNSERFKGPSTAEMPMPGSADLRYGGYRSRDFE